MCWPSGLNDLHTRFYLSFENSICEDYATEKFFNALKSEIVPVSSNVKWGKWIYGYLLDYKSHNSHIWLGSFFKGGFGGSQLLTLGPTKVKKSDLAQYQKFF